eukprot:TRINITY_DN6717_c0_g1_i1.p1 TRINITY_DN6717_c0_g1~~TRINITY_DN6717_c0_g1_i1.p1  ORF type:complete len:755 (-),score=147.76 TRINITY_DN6717_c0_g1_i1:78-2129(-)
MASLDVLPPDVLTRVSEYVPEIIEMVEKICERGYGYKANGSVYFDTQKFADAEPHEYPKLMPASANDVELLEDGEGSLTDSGAKSEKKSPKDFALWKKSNPGEPWWDYPGLGKGRPGWHIECSAMAGSLLGEQMDIHCGGVDLRFPHHDNEMAQAEAFFDCKQWVNYHLHSGHLHIEGLKMSKSLKNFLTIQDTRKQLSARQVRLYFVFKHLWYKVMDYTSAGMAEIKGKETNILRFLEFAQAVQGQYEGLIITQRWNENDIKLHTEFLELQTLIHNSILDNFNTPAACAALFEIITKTNSYMDPNPKAACKPLLIRAIVEYVVKMFGVFGITFPDYGFGPGSVKESNEEIIVRIAQIKDFGTLASDLREQLRGVVFTKGPVDSAAVDKIVGAALEKLDSLKPTDSGSIAQVYHNTIEEFLGKVKQNSANTAMLKQLSDEFRDEVMPNLGIRLGDGATSLFSWSYVNSSVLKDEIRKRKEEEIATAQNKLKRVTKSILKRLTDDLADKETTERVDGKDYFREFHATSYSKFGEDGLPTHNTDGGELGKKAKKRLAPMLKKYLRKRTLLLEAMEKDPGMMQRLRNEIKSISDYNKVLNGKLTLDAHTGTVGEDFVLKLAKPKDASGDAMVFPNGPKKLSLFTATLNDSDEIVVTINGAKDGLYVLGIFQGTTHVTSVEVTLSPY